MTPHFAHHDSTCPNANTEPETAAHLQGKKILYEWLSRTYPDAYVEYEEHIVETGQIADVYVEHSEEGMEGLRWAFEFQNSPLSPTDWESRHELYKSQGIQDFWILNKATYMKFSKAQDITDARLRNDLEKTIYNKTGLCYFLDVESSELTIDFEFTTSWVTKVVKGYERKNEYTYHRPIHHTVPLEQVKIRMNDEFKHGVLVYSEVESQMEERLNRILAILRGAKAKKEEQELQEKAKELKLLIQKNYGDEQTEVIWQFMKRNKEVWVDNEEHLTELTHDIRQLTKEEFLTKYEAIFEKLLVNLEEYTAISDSENLEDTTLGSLSYETDLFSLSFLEKQGSHSLKDYLMDIHQEKVTIVTYVYDTYKKDLEKLATMNFRAIKPDIEKIRSILIPWGSNPTATDYAIRYGRLDTVEEADAYMKQIKEKIIYHNPSADFEDW